MTETDGTDVALSSAERSALREVLADHSVRIALVFGSVADPNGEPADIDLAVEFADRRPTDDGYADAYLKLYTALEDRLDRAIDLVDVHSMSPRFASIVFDDGVRILGTAERQRALEEQFPDENPSVGDARERVAAAVDRLREGSS